MPAKKYIVRLDREERQYLNRLVKTGKSAAYKRQRAQVLLKADVGEEDREALKDQALPQVRQLHPHHADAVLARVRAQVGGDRRHRRWEQPDGEAERAQGGEEDVRGQVQRLAQDGQEQVVLPEAALLSAAASSRAVWS